VCFLCLSTSYKECFTGKVIVLAVFKDDVDSGRKLIKIAENLTGHLTDLLNAVQSGSEDVGQPLKLTLFIFQRKPLFIYTISHLLIQYKDIKINRIILTILLYMTFLETN